MNHNDKALIEILKASLNNTKIKFTAKNNINWENLIKESRIHQISPLVYYTLDRNTMGYINEKMVEEWKKEVFMVNMIQKRHINEISQIAFNLKKLGIEIIVLKGIVLRNLYSIPELRTMSDGDILIRKNDFERVRDYLTSIGYECGPDDNKIHRGFIHPNKLEIEIHWKLINDEFFNGNKDELEENIWKRKIPFKINNVVTNTLCIEDFLIHLCFHMLVHARYSSFGLRQLFDLAIFLKYNNEKIEWENFINGISGYGGLKFTKGILIVVNRLFNIQIPKYILNDNLINDYEIELLIRNILLSGAHGEREFKIEFYNLYKTDNNNPYEYNKFFRLFKFIFPKTKDLKNWFSYVRKNCLLIPIGWMHYLFRIIKKNGLISTIKYISQALDIGKRRTLVIKIFNL